MQMLYLWYNKYMHKHVGMVMALVFVTLVFAVPSLSNKFFAFFFIGLVPFTNYTLPVEAMLALYALLLALGAFAIGHLLSVATSPVKRDIKAREQARKKVLHSTAKQYPKATAQQKKHYQPATDN